MLSWLRRLFKAIGLFINEAYHAGIWILSTFVVVTFVSVSISYELNIPDEKAKLEESSLKRKVQIEDGERMCGVYQHLLDDTNQVVKVMNHYASILKEVLDSKRLDNRQQQFEEVHNSIAETENRLKLTIAFLKGLQFREPAYGDEIKVHEEFIVNQLGTVNMLHELCDSYINGDAEKFAQLTKEFPDKSSPISLAQKTNDTQLKSAKKKLESTLESYRIEEERVKAQTNMLFYKGLLKYFVISFSAVYIAAIFIKIGRNMKNPEKSSEHSKKVIPKRNKIRKRNKRLRS